MCSSDLGPVRILRQQQVQPLANPGPPALPAPTCTSGVQIERPLTTGLGLAAARQHRGEIVSFPPGEPDLVPGRHAADPSDRKSVV